jgi:hypothetical protein
MDSCNVSIRRWWHENTSAHHTSCKSNICTLFLLLEDDEQSANKFAKAFQVHMLVHFKASAYSVLQHTVLTMKETMQFN